MLNLSVPEDVFGFFASDLVGPMATILRAASNPTCPIFESLDLFLRSIPQDVVVDTCRNREFQFFWKEARDIDRMARVWIAERFLSDEIARQRLLFLRDQDRSLCSTPYEQPALADVEVDDEGLVPLSSFKFDGSRLIHSGYAFTIFLYYCFSKFHALAGQRSVQRSVDGGHKRKTRPFSLRHGAGLSRDVL
jgi:hypothetical protein